VRTQRIVQQDGVDEKAAKKTVEASDKARQQYLQRFYDIAQELPTHFDLTVNTDVLTADQVARVVVATARG
jgi:cytidylate kinase